MENSGILKLKRKKRKEFKVTEGKTKKERIINITSIFEEVLPYAEDLKSTWLIPSLKGDKPISIIQAYRQLEKSGDFSNCRIFRDSLY